MEAAVSGRRVSLDPVNDQRQRLEILRACPVKIDDLPPRRREMPRHRKLSWLLDSDVFFQPAKKRGEVGVITWLETHKQDCFTSSIVIAQPAFWVRSKRGQQRVALKHQGF